MCVEWFKGTPSSSNVSVLIHSAFYFHSEKIGKSRVCCYYIYTCGNRCRISQSPFFVQDVMFGAK